MSPPTVPIAAVERDTGLSKDTLRVWERRYGFPQPLRDSLGERAYPADQVDKLRLIKRLLDAGQRPGKVVGQSLDVLEALASAPGAEAYSAEPPLEEDLQPILEAVYAHDNEALRRILGQRLASIGLARFVLEVVAPLNRVIGDAWLRGRMQVFEEHAYTESVQVVLRHALHALPRPPEQSRPLVMLSTFPGEPHGLGLLMAECLLSLEGCRCISLGVQTPIWDLVLAAEAHHADIVALSFSGVLNANVLLDGLQELRQKLPATVSIWAGGSAPVLHRRPVQGVAAMATLTALPHALREWRLIHSN